jgi:hypothetical protein
MKWHLQLELKLDLRCRLPVPSVYVSQFYISWHWDPDALARWHTVISTCRLVSKAGRPCAEANAKHLGAQVSCGM